jgi:hypothetical protein
MILKMLLICEKEILSAKENDDFMDYIKRELLNNCYLKLKNHYYNQK